MGIKKEDTRFSLPHIASFYVILIHRYVYLCVFLLATCPIMGQVYHKEPSVQHFTHKIASTSHRTTEVAAIPFSEQFKVSVTENKVYIELNEVVLGQPMLFVRHGTGYQQVVWRRNADQIRLEAPRIESLSGTILPIGNDSQIKKNNIGFFPILYKKSTTNTYCIDVTELFTTHIVDWYHGFKETVIPNLTRIHSVGYLKNEVILKTERVVSREQMKLTLPVDFSFFMLSKPIQPRLFDYRIGYFVEDELSSINLSQENRTASIRRWHLEKQAKKNNRSEPIQPITFYLGSEIPDKWKPYIKLGILEWLPAFEAAGFKNAIAVKELPTENKNWTTHSVNYSVVRWTSNEGIRGLEQGGGSTVSAIVDLRSGEILKCDINIGSSLQNLSDAYFIRCAPMDSRAQHYPFPDDLMGELIQSVVAHEAGHAFGIKDANYGEYAYPFENMRDEAWLRKMGHTPSIMTYARHNYIVQPKDEIPPSLLIQKVGPMDQYMIAWGYTPFPKIENPKEELPYLENIIKKQESVQWYRYSISKREIIGPGQTNNVVDNNDPIKSTEFGLRNLKRVVALIPKITANEKDTGLRERLYDKTLKLWFEEMEHVLSLVGGYTVFYKAMNQSGDSYTKIPIKTQKAALAFLMTNAFNTPDWLTDRKLTSTFKYSTTQNKLLYFQLRLLLQLLEPSRCKRLEMMEASREYHGITKYMLSTLNTELWSELSQDDIKISSDRQELQSAYITFLMEAISEPKTYTSIHQKDKFYVQSDYVKSVFMSELILLNNQINVRIESVENRITHGHLRRSLKQIQGVL